MADVGYVKSTIARDLHRQASCQESKAAKRPHDPGNERSAQSLRRMAKFIEGMRDGHPLLLRFTAVDAAFAEGSSRWTREQTRKEGEQSTIEHLISRCGFHREITTPAQCEKWLTALAESVEQEFAEGKESPAARRKWRARFICAIEDLTGTENPFADWASLREAWSEAKRSLFAGHRDLCAFGWVLRESCFHDCERDRVLIRDVQIWLTGDDLDSSGRLYNALDAWTDAVAGIDETWSVLAVFKEIGLQGLEQFFAVEMEVRIARDGSEMIRPYASCDELWCPADREAA